MITTTRRLEFDAGHRVLGHGGKCRHLHGHRYAVEITVQAERVDNLGMVIDFGQIKERVGAWIDENLDHRLILNPDDPQALHMQATEEIPPYLMPQGENPTAENLAKLIFGVSERMLPTFHIVGVRVWETPNCFADYYV